MEHKITERHVEDTKSSLTALAVGSGFVFAVSAIARIFIAGADQIPLQPLASLFGIGMILSLLVSLLALNTRLQVQMDESEAPIEAGEC